MDMNEMITQQLAANPQLAYQIMQMIQMMQQNGGSNSLNQGNPQHQPMNWNSPTNPMAAMLQANLMNLMNNQNNNPKPAQNQSQPAVASSQQTDEGVKVSSVRIIKSPEEIRADEIPMNGGISLFVQDDLKVIYGKRWTNNGTVENKCFVLENNDQKVSEPANNTSNVSINPDVFFEKISEKISEMIDEKMSQFNFPDKNELVQSKDN